MWFTHRCGERQFAVTSSPSYESEVTKFFRPEFFNRLDAVITFKPLSRIDVQAIAHKELSELPAREGLISRGIRLNWSERVVELIAREGYDHRLGARPLQRALERLVVTPLARWKVANPRARDLTLDLDLDQQGAVQVVASTEPMRHPELA